MQFMPRLINLRLHAFAPSDHMWSTLLLPRPPQFLNQAPPGAQQLTLPDFRNVPHLGHVILRSIAEVIDGVLTNVLLGFLTTSSRSGSGRRDAYCPGAGVVTSVVADVHAAHRIVP